MKQLQVSEPPDGFHCPYKRQCWQRELLRWVMPALLAWCLTWLTACNGSFRVRGFPPGASFSASWSEGPLTSTKP
jgi:hypothetical protein